MEKNALPDTQQDHATSQSGVVQQQFWEKQTPAFCKVESKRHDNVRHTVQLGMR